MVFCLFEFVCLISIYHRVLCFGWLRVYFPPGMSNKTKFWWDFEDFVWEFQILVPKTRSLKSNQNVSNDSKRITKYVGQNFAKVLAQELREFQCFLFFQMHKKYIKIGYIDRFHRVPSWNFLWGIFLVKNPSISGTKRFTCRHSILHCRHIGSTAESCPRCPRCVAQTASTGTHLRWNISSQATGGGCCLAISCISKGNP